MMTNKTTNLAIILIAVFAIVLTSAGYSQTADGTYPGAPKGAVVEPLDKSEGFHRVTATKSDFKDDKVFTTTTFTFGDIVSFATFDSTEIVIYNQANDTVDHFTIHKDEYYVSSTGGGVFRVEGSKSFSLIAGDPVSRSVVGYFAVNENGYPLSTKHRTYMPNHEWSGEYFIIFAYQDGTEYELRNLATGSLISAGILNEGEHYVYEQNDVFLGVSSNKPVSALTYTDQGYYYPASNGKFKGTLFYGFSGQIGGWTNGIIVTAYEDDTPVLVTNTETADTIGIDTLQEGQVLALTNNDDRFVTVESGKPVTVANTPYAGWSGSYAYLTRHIGNHGIGISDKFYVPTIAGRFDMFSYDNDNAITVIRQSTNDTIWNDTLQQGEGYYFNSSKDVYKVVSSGKVSIVTSNSGSWGADFMPLNYATSLPDLAISSSNIFIDPDSASAGDPVVLEATVHNTSGIDVENVTIQFFDGHPENGGIPIGDLHTVPQIDSLGSATVSSDWVAPEDPSAHDVFVLVDGDNTITESNESNNIADKPLVPNEDLLPPLAVIIDAPYGLDTENNELINNPFTITINVFNNGEGTAENVFGTLNTLPTGLELADGSDPMQQEIGNLEPGQSVQLTWTLFANEDASGVLPYSIIITADNNEDKLVNRGIRTPFTATFNVDLSRMIADAAKDFDPAADTVYMSGSMAEWAMPGSDSIYMMTDADEDHIYTLSLLLDPGNYAYKHFYVPGGDGTSWDYGEWQGGNDRTFYMPESDTSIYNYWGGYKTSFMVSDGSNMLEDASISINGETLTTDAEGHAFTVLGDGDYDYTITAEGYADTTSALTVAGKDTTLNMVMEMATGINSTPAKEAVRIYPNPSRSYVTIQHENLQAVQLLTLRGKVVQEQIATSDRLRLKVNNLNAGLYILKLRTEDGQFLHRRLLVQD